MVKISFKLCPIKQKQSKYLINVAEPQTFFLNVFMPTKLGLLSNSEILIQRNISSNNEGKTIHLSITYGIDFLLQLFSAAYCDIISLRNTLDPINMDNSLEINLAQKHAKQNHVQKSLLDFRFKL